MNLLKRLFCGSSLILALSLVICGGETGCKAPAQRKAIVTISTVDTTAKSAYGGFMSLVIDHTLPTNDVPKVTTLYKQVMDGCRLAALVSENGTNALASAQLSDELAQLLAFVASVTPK